MVGEKRIVRSFFLSTVNVAIRPARWFCEREDLSEDQRRFAKSHAKNLFYGITLKVKVFTRQVKGKFSFRVNDLTWDVKSSTNRKNHEAS